MWCRLCRAWTLLTQVSTLAFVINGLGGGGTTALLGPRPPHCWGFSSHTDTHTLCDSSELIISSSQRPLPTQHTTNTRDERPCPQQDSNPRSQQSSGFKPTP
jgi:hypothetical protein